MSDSFKKEIICLANSRKKSGRCVAGIDVSNQQWVRLVNPNGEELSRHDISYEDGSTTQVLDIISVQLKSKESLYYQPENYVIDKGYWWEKIGEFKVGKIQSLCDNHEYIMLDQADFLTCGECNTMHPQYSLMLIKPTMLEFQKIIKSFNGRQRQQIRALFEYNGREYNLAVTDDNWEQQYNNLDTGWYKEKAPQKFNLTISLGECFSGRHYKLVSSVINT